MKSMFETEPRPSPSPPGTTVMTMMALDADDPGTDNAALRYTIVRQSPDKPTPHLFYIDEERGDIVTVISHKLLDREVGRLDKVCVCVASHSVPSGTLLSPASHLSLALLRYISSPSTSHQRCQ